MSAQGGIVVFANERVGFRTLERVIAAGYPVRAVFTSHESRRPRIADWQDFRPLAERHPEIPFHFIDTPSAPQVVEAVAAGRPDLVLVVSWSQIIPASVLSIPPRGTVGIHYSLLPDRRGGAPLAWAFIDGLDRTGLTLIYYDEGTDTGDMIDQVPLQITFEDTVKTLLDRIMIELPELVLRNLDGLLDGTAPRIVQDHSKATLTPARKPSDGIVDLTRTDVEIYNWVRGQTAPYPGAFLWVVDGQGRRRKMTIPAARFDAGGRLVLEGTLGPLQEEA